MQDGSCLEQRPQSSSGEDDRAAAAAEAPRKPITTATPAVATPDMDTVMTVRKTMKTMTAPCLAGDETSPCGPVPAWKDPAIRPADVSAPRPPTVMSDDGAPTSEPILHVSTTPSALPLEKSPDEEAGGDCSKHNPSRTHDVSVPRLDDGRECRDWRGKEVILCDLQMQGLNGRRGRVRTEQPNGDRYTVDLQGGRTVRLKPANMRIDEKPRDPRSQWLLWNPPEKVTRLARGAIRSVYETVGGSKGPAELELDLLEKRSVAMFRAVWGSHTGKPENAETERLWQMLKGNRDARVQLAIRCMEHLIVEVREWNTHRPDGDAEPLMVCCARCLEDAVQENLHQLLQHLPP